jgi:hypothetical protein
MDQLTTNGETGKREEGTGALLGRGFPIESVHIQINKLDKER